MLSRRQTVQGAIGLALGKIKNSSAQNTPRILISESTSLNGKLWRGFNLLSLVRHDIFGPFDENIFRVISDWGFNFVRLPLNYRCWAKNPAKPTEVDYSVIDYIDNAVQYGLRHNIHINLALHRAPGYCVSPPEERSSLWIDPEAKHAFLWTWNLFAERYKSVSREFLSFNLLNEPNGKVNEEDYRSVVLSAIDVIRSISPERSITVDGLDWGRRPLPGVSSHKIIQSTRGYAPEELTHFNAQWNNAGRDAPVPSWPLKQGDKIVWDENRLRADFSHDWGNLIAEGCAVHVGEWGVYNKTPHRVTIQYMRSRLEVWKLFSCGWALWNFSGPFGVVNSERTDARYEKAGSLLVDKEMLSLLQAY